MKRLFVLLLFLSGAAGLAAQHFSWGPYVYPNFSSRRLIVLGANITEKAIQEIEAREIGRPSLSAGLEGGWRNNKLGFRLGLGVAETGYRTVREFIPTDEPNPDGASERRFVYRNLNVVAPVEIDFVHELDDKNNFFFLMGGALSYNLTNKALEIRYAGDIAERIDAELPDGSFRRLNAAILAGAGWEHAVSGRVSFYVQPTFHFWLSGMLRDADLNRSLYDFGLRAGLRFHRVE